MKLVNYKDVDVSKYKELYDIYTTHRITNYKPTAFHFYGLGSEGLDVLVDDPELLKSKCDDFIGYSFPSWVYDLHDKIGKRCYIYKDESTHYTLEGFVFSFMDYYYYLKCDNGSHILGSCVGHIDFL